MKKTFQQLLILYVGICLSSIVWTSCSSEKSEPQKLNTLKAPNPELSCMECHQEQTKHWERSHHALANLSIDEKDEAIFQAHGGVEYFDNTYTFKRGELKWTHKDNPEKKMPVEGKIGIDPLWQYLAKTDKGYQAVSMAYDPKKNEWFNVFGEDDRQPYEWGHWSGQGMNWNANCAYCHTSDYKKKFDAKNFTYHSTWSAQGVSCTECHGELENHVKTARKGQPVKPSTFTDRQVMENCATCHSLREELSDGEFEPGDSFHDHFRLRLPGMDGRYYPDGQVREENFVYTSFNLNKMHKAGVTCMDCHDPHSLELVKPIENNELCLNCHATGLESTKRVDSRDIKAIPINPTFHSRHKEGSLGNRCVECHMTKTTYMQRDARRDHGFTFPDPLLTKELGIPNACNKCHEDQSVDWAVKWSEKWYGEKLAKSRQRKRARYLYALRQGDASVLSDLQGFLEKESIPAWQAALMEGLANYAGSSEISSLFLKYVNDENTLVRSRAVSGLSESGSFSDVVKGKLSDKARVVRMNAAVSSFQTLDEGSDIFSELTNYLYINSDRVMGAMRYADLLGQRGKKEVAIDFANLALKMDSQNPEALSLGAHLFNRIGDLDKAITSMQRAVRTSGNRSEYLFSLALLYAENKNALAAIRVLEKLTGKDKGHARAWYNLSVLYGQQKRKAKALSAIQQALRLESENKDFLEAKAYFESL